jgi:hypothetical protein
MGDPMGQVYYQALAILVARTFLVSEARRDRSATSHWRLTRQVLISLVQR